MFLLKKLTRDKQESAFDENGIRRDKKKLAFTADTKKSKNLSKSGSRWKMIKKSISTINRMDYGDDLIRRVREDEEVPMKDIAHFGFLLLSEGWGGSYRSQSSTTIKSATYVIEWAVLRGYGLTATEKRKFAQAHAEVWRTSGINSDIYNLWRARDLYKEVIMTIEGAIDASAWIEYSRVLQHLGDNNESVKLLMKLLNSFEDHEDFPAFLFYTGCMLKATKDFDRAGSYFFEAMNSGPPKLFTRLDVMFIVARNLEQSTQDDDVPVEDGYRMVHMNMMADKILPPDSDFDEWLHSCNTWIVVADKCAMHGCYDLAADLYGQGLSRDNYSFKRPQLWFNFAKASIRCGQVAEAQLAVKQAMTIDPYNRAFHQAYESWGAQRSVFEEAVHEDLPASSLLPILEALPPKIIPTELLATRLQSLLRGFSTRRQLSRRLLSPQKSKANASVYANSNTINSPASTTGVTLSPSNLDMSGDNVSVSLSVSGGSPSPLKNTSFEGMEIVGAGTENVNIVNGVNGVSLDEMSLASSVTSIGSLGSMSLAGSSVTGAFKGRTLLERLSSKHSLIVGGHPVFIKVESDWAGTIRYIQLYDIIEDSEQTVKIHTPFSPVMDSGKQRHFTMEIQTIKRYNSYPDAHHHFHKHIGFAVRFTDIETHDYVSKSFELLLTPKPVAAVSTALLQGSSAAMKLLDTDNVDLTYKKKGDGRQLHVVVVEDTVVSTDVSNYLIYRGTLRYGRFLYMFRLENKYLETHVTLFQVASDQSIKMIFKREHFDRYQSIRRVRKTIMQIMKTHPALRMILSKGRKVRTAIARAQSRSAYDRPGTSASIASDRVGTAHSQLSTAGEDVSMDDLFQLFNNGSLGEFPMQFMNLVHPNMYQHKCALRIHIHNDKYCPCLVTMGLQPEGIVLKITSADSRPIFTDCYEVLDAGVNENIVRDPNFCRRPSENYFASEAKKKELRDQAILERVQKSIKEQEEALERKRQQRLSRRQTQKKSPEKAVASTTTIRSSPVVPSEKSKSVDKDQSIVIEDSLSQQSGNLVASPAIDIEEKGMDGVSKGSEATPVSFTTNLSPEFTAYAPPVEPPKPSSAVIGVDLSNDVLEEEKAEVTEEKEKDGGKIKNEEDAKVSPSKKGGKRKKSEASPKASANAMAGFLSSKKKDASPTSESKKGKAPTKSSSSTKKRKDKDSKAVKGTLSPTQTTPAPIDDENADSTRNRILDYSEGTPKAAGSPLLPALLPEELAPASSSPDKETGTVSVIKMANLDEVEEEVKVANLDKVEEVKVEETKNESDELDDKSVLHVAKEEEESTRKEKESVRFSEQKPSMSPNSNPSSSVSPIRKKKKKKSMFENNNSPTPASTNTPSMSPSPVNEKKKETQSNQAITTDDKSTSSNSERNIPNNPTVVNDPDDVNTSDVFDDNGDKVVVELIPENISAQVEQALAYIQSYYRQAVSVCAQIYGYDLNAPVTEVDVNSAVYSDVTEANPSPISVEASTNRSTPEVKSGLKNRFSPGRSKLKLRSGSGKKSKSRGYINPESAPDEGDGDDDTVVSRLSEDSFTSLRHEHDELAIPPDISVSISASMANGSIDSTESLHTYFRGKSTDPEFFPPEALQDPQALVAALRYGIIDAPLEELPKTVEFEDDMSVSTLGQMSTNSYRNRVVPGGVSTSAKPMLIPRTAINAATSNALFRGAPMYESSVISPIMTGPLGPPDRGKLPHYRKKKKKAMEDDSIAGWTTRTGKSVNTHASSARSVGSYYSVSKSSNTKTLGSNVLDPIAFLGLDKTDTGKQIFGLNATSEGLAPVIPPGSRGGTRQSKDGNKNKLTSATMPIPILKTLTNVSSFTANASIDDFDKKGYTAGHGAFHSTWENKLGSFKQKYGGKIKKVKKLILELQSIVDTPIDRNEAMLSLADSNGSLPEALGKLKKMEYCAELKLVCRMIDVDGFTSSVVQRSSGEERYNKLQEGVLARARIANVSSPIKKAEEVAIVTANEALSYHHFALKQDDLLVKRRGAEIRLNLHDERKAGKAGGIVLKKKKKKNTNKYRKASTSTDKDRDEGSPGVKIDKTLTSLIKEHPEMVVMSRRDAYRAYEDYLLERSPHLDYVK